MARMSMINCVIFLLGQVIFLTVIKADVLETTIITENNDVIALRWVEAEPFLANEHLPIWTTNPHDDSLIHDETVMAEIGKFRMYYDLDKNSAIVLFENQNCIYGPIDVRYQIQCLQLDQLSGKVHRVGESSRLRSVTSEKFPDADKPTSRATCKDRTATPYYENTDDLKMLIRSMVNTDVPSTSRDGPPPAKCPRRSWHYEDSLITVYPEILIFVTRDKQRVEIPIYALVAEYIIRFNAVAMLFAKLATDDIKIHINIAGILFDMKDDGITETVFGNNHRTSSEAVNLLLDYMRMKRRSTSTSSNVFVADSFDMILFMTSNEWQGQEQNPGGMSAEVFDMMVYMGAWEIVHSRKYKMLASLVSNAEMSHSYVYAAREIAHLMTVQDDPPRTFESCVNGGPCIAIMQSGTRHCPNSLLWSRRNVKTFKKFLSGNTNRCYFVNRPRSLHPYDRPIKLLTPADQCFCYGFFPSQDGVTHLDTKDTRNICQKHLKCRIPKTTISPPTAQPMPGTPCAENDSEVCWRYRCVDRL